MGSEHRKIELQSRADLTFITSQLRTAARQKLDLHLPPVSDASEPDELRRQVEELVDAFVAKVLRGIRENASINGMDVVQQQRGDDIVMEGVGTDEGVSEVEREEYEAFDDKLRAKLSAAVARRDALFKGISAHRRTTPGDAARKWQEQFERENEMLSQVLEQGGEVAVLDLEVQRHEEMTRNWERAVEGLGRLNKGLPETRARLERARDVVGYLGGEKTA